MTLRLAPPLVRIIPSARELCACHEVARWLYLPAEVWPYLRQDLLALEGARGVSVDEAAQDEQAAQARALCRWVRRRVELEQGPEDRTQRPEDWRSPGEALWHGAGCAAELALVLWSAAPLLGLPVGRLVFGRRDGRTHAWVEWTGPEGVGGLYADPATGEAGPLADRPAGYLPHLTVWPPLPAAQTAA